MRPMVGGVYQTESLLNILLTGTGPTNERWKYKAKTFGALYVGVDTYDENGAYRNDKTSLLGLASRLDDNDTVYVGDPVVVTRSFGELTAGVVGTHVGQQLKDKDGPPTKSNIAFLFLLLQSPVVVPPPNFTHPVEQWIIDVLRETTGVLSPNGYHRYCAMVPPDHVNALYRLEDGHVLPNFVECHKSPSSRHEYVNVGFTSVTMACRHCGTDENGGDP